MDVEVLQGCELLVGVEIVGVYPSPSLECEFIR